MQSRRHSPAQHCFTILVMAPHCPSQRMHQNSLSGQCSNNAGQKDGSLSLISAKNCRLKAQISRSGHRSIASCLVSSGQSDIFDTCWKGVHLRSTQISKPWSRRSTKSPTRLRNAKRISCLASRRCQQIYVTSKENRTSSLTPSLGQMVSKLLR